MGRLAAGLGLSRDDEATAELEVRFFPVSAGIWITGHVGHLVEGRIRPG